MKRASGQSLIEALAAILIFTFGSIVMLTLVTGAKKLNEAARAETAAQSEMQLLRELGRDLVPGRVVLRLGDREEELEVVFSGDGAVFFSEGEP